MDPDVFITIAFCAEVAAFMIAGAVVGRHERRRDALESNADLRERGGSARRTQSPLPAIRQGPDPQTP